LLTTIKDVFSVIPLLEQASARFVQTQTNNLDKTDMMEVIGIIMICQDPPVQAQQATSQEDTQMRLVDVKYEYKFGVPKVAHQDFT